MAVQVVTVSGLVLLQDGVTPAAGVISFVRNAEVLDAAGDVLLAPVSTSATLDATGAFTVDLTATDEGDPVGTVYRVTEKVEGAPVRVFSVALPAAAPAVQYVDLVPVAQVPEYDRLATRLFVQEVADAIGVGPQGDSIEYVWDGTRLGIRVEGELDYIYVDLEGAQGIQGIQGVTGDTGANLEFVWDGTRLGVRVEGQPAFTYVDLEGAQGIQGIQGVQGDTGDIGAQFQGTWVAGAYAVGDLVEYQGSTYLTAVSTSAVPPSAPWELVAEAGTDGVDGAGSPSSALSPSVDAASQTGVVGTSTLFAREDHGHPSGAFETGGAVSGHAGAVDPHADRAYADGLASNYATAAQGTLAGTAVQPADIDTLAELNATVTDATLDTSSATRVPTDLSVTDAKVAAAAAIAQSKIDGLVDGLVNVAPFAKEGELAVVDGAGRYRFPFAVTVIDVTAAVNTAPTGASVLVDVDKATVAAPSTWATIFTTQTNRPEVAVSAFTSGVETPDVTSFAAGDFMRVNVDQIGSTVAGSDLSVFVTYRRA